MSYTFRAGDLPKLDLDVDRGSDFLAWEKQWNSYMILSGLSGADAAIKVHALKFCMSCETLTIVDNLGLTKAERAQIIAGLKRYVRGRINETVERRNFRQRKQASGEAFDDYLISLRELAKTCNFCDDKCLQNSLRDQLVEGIIDPDTFQDLLKEQDLTLEKAIKICRAMEAAKKELYPKQSTASSALDSASGEEINVVSRYKRSKKTPVSSVVNPGTCRGCGQAEHPEGRRSSCPAFSSVCTTCGKTGHYHKVCLQKSTSSARRDKKTPPQANRLPLSGPLQAGAPGVCLSGVRSVNSTDPAPTLAVHVKALNGPNNACVLGLALFLFKVIVIPFSSSSELGVLRSE